MKYEYKPFYRRKLPHIHSPGSTLFITFRLAGSIPQQVLQQWFAEKTLRDKQPLGSSNRADFNRRWFAQFEEILHKAESGPTWLGDSRIAQIVADSLRYRDGRVYDLLAFSLMSNHAHTVFTPFLDDSSVRVQHNAFGHSLTAEEPTLPAIMQSLKGYTAYKANRVLGRTGQFWEEESYDHEVSNGAKLDRIIRYVLDNPVKARLVAHWSQWKWSYCKWPERF